LPRTVIEIFGKVFSKIRRCASWAPVSATIGIAVGTVISAVLMGSIEGNLTFNRAARRTDARQEYVGEREIRSDLRLHRY